MKEENGETFGARLGVLRRAAGLTQAALAEKLNVHSQTVSKWERDVTEPDISQFGELSSALGVSLERVLGGDESGGTFTGNFDPVRCGAAIAGLRAGRGESQKELAGALGVSPDAVSRWERGAACPDVGRLTALAAHFGVPASRIYCGVSEKKESPARAFFGRKVSVAVPIALSAAFLCAIAIMLGVFFGVGKTEPPAPTVGAYSDGFAYSLLSDGSIEITGYRGTDMDVRIPPTIDGKRVTAIGERTFMNDVFVSSAVIPEGVTTIGADAFSGCKKLTEVTLPSTLKTIEGSAFWCCGLVSVTIPSGVEYIGVNAFAWCSDLKRIVIPESVTHLENNFYNCPELTVYAECDEAPRGWGEIYCSVIYGYTRENG